MSEIDKDTGGIRSFSGSGHGGGRAMGEIRCPGKGSGYCAHTQRQGVGRGMASGSGEGDGAGYGSGYAYGSGNNCGKGIGIALSLTLADDLKAASSAEKQNNAIFRSKNNAN